MRGEKSPLPLPFSAEASLDLSAPRGTHRSEPPQARGPLLSLAAVSCYPAQNRLLAWLCVAPATLLLLSTPTDLPGFLNPGTANSYDFCHAGLAITEWKYTSGFAIACGFEFGTRKDKLKGHACKDCLPFCLRSSRTCTTCRVSVHCCC